MDLKITKHPVSVNEKVFEQKHEIPFDIDFTMPDYCPDIVRILKCCIDPTVGSKSINGRSVTVEGTVSANVIYTCKENKIHNYTQSVPFSKTFECENEIPDSTVEAVAVTDYVNCRAVSERRVDLHGAATLKIKIIARKKYSVIADIDDKNIQLNKATVPSFNSVGFGEKSIIVEEQLTVSESSAPIENIIRYKAHPVVKEAKAIRNKVVVKGSIYVTVLYSSENCSRYHCFRTAVPFNGFLDISGVFEECVVKAKATLCNLEIKVLKTAEPKDMSLEAKLNLCADTYCNDEIPVISDAFSTKNLLDTDSVELTLQKISSVVNDTFILKKTFKYSDDTLKNIIDCWADTTVKSVKTENSKLTAVGEICFSLLAEGNSDNVSFYEKTEDFCFESTAEVSPENACTADFEQVTLSYTILSDSELEVRIEYNVKLEIKTVKKVSALLELQKGTTREENKSCTLVIYYATKGESTWDIAKEHNSVIEEINEINGLNSSVLENDVTLLIPVY